MYIHSTEFGPTFINYHKKHKQVIEYLSISVKANYTCLAVCLFCWFCKMRCLTFETEADALGGLCKYSRNGELYVKFNK